MNLTNPANVAFIANFILRFVLFCSGKIFLPQKWLQIPSRFPPMDVFSSDFGVLKRCFPTVLSEWTLTTLKLITFSSNPRKLFNEFFWNLSFYVPHFSFLLVVLQSTQRGRLQRFLACYAYGRVYSIFCQQLYQSSGALLCIWCFSKAF